MDKKNPKKKWKKRLRKIRVSYEVVHPDAEFREELENILSRVEVQNPDGNTEVEYLNFNFLPFVVENDPKEARIPALLDEINQWEVDGVEIVLPEAEQVSSTTGKPAQEHEDNGEVSFDACAFVNWEELSEVPAGYRLEADSEVIPQSDETYAPGQSIFEDLFRKCDEDSKLILLSEMLNLGDQKELAFLGSLNGETSPKIRKKIEFVSSKLRKRLQKETPDAEKTDALIRWATIDDQSDTVNFDLDNIEKRHS